MNFLLHFHLGVSHVTITKLKLFYLNLTYEEHTKALTTSHCFKLSIVLRAYEDPSFLQVGVAL